MTASALELPFDAGRFDVVLLQHVAMNTIGSINARSSSGARELLIRFVTASALELPFDAGRFDVVLLQHVAMNISARTRLYREIRRVLKSGGSFAIFDVVLNDGQPHYPVPWARTPATRFLLTAAATSAAIEPAGFRPLTPSIARVGSAVFANLGVVMGPDFAQLVANLGRNL